jgi:UDP-2-acetamido-3-amino-2,3-dideoxy-glucuronate N-acetyltransferase
VVTTDVPAYGLMVGVPARRIGWMCQCGVRLTGLAMEWSCPDCGREYRESAGRLEPVDRP